MRLLVFSIWGDFAHFRQIFTTSSPLTYSIPPLTTIGGILGALTGKLIVKDEVASYGRDTYLKYFNASTFNAAIEVLSPVKKVIMNIKHQRTKNEKKGTNHLLIRSEFIKDPKYNFYLYFNNPEMHGLVKSMLQEHKSYFTVSLGLSELIANYEFFGELECEPNESDEAQDISSVLPIESIEKLEEVFQNPGEYKIIPEYIPISMKPDRSVDIYKKVIFEAGTKNEKPKALKVRSKHVFRIENGKNVVFLGPFLPFK